MKRTPMKRDPEAYREWQQRSRDRQIEKRRKLQAIHPSKREEARQSFQRKPRKPLAKHSQAQKTRLAKYRPLAKAFLADPLNEWCEICTRRREAGENIRINYATEVHHKFLRGGMNLYRGFIASCFSCRLWPHDNKTQARALGLLGTAAEIANTR